MDNDPRIHISIYGDIHININTSSDGQRRQLLTPNSILRRERERARTRERERVNFSFDERNVLDVLFSFLNNNDGTSSDETIARNTESIRATSEMSTEVCPICHAEFADGSELLRIRPCDHVFHRECIEQWFGRSNSCPVCRNQIN